MTRRVGCGADGQTNHRSVDRDCFCVPIRFRRQSRGPFSVGSFLRGALGLSIHHGRGVWHVFVLDLSGLSISRRVALKPRNGSAALHVAFTALEDVVLGVEDVGNMTSTLEERAYYTHSHWGGHRPQELSHWGQWNKQVAGIVLEVYLRVHLVDGSFVVVGGPVQLAATEEGIRFGLLGPANDLQ